MYPAMTTNTPGKLRDISAFQIKKETLKDVSDGKKARIYRDLMQQS